MQENYVSYFIEISMVLILYYGRTALISVCLQDRFICSMLSEDLYSPCCTATMHEQCVDMKQMVRTYSCT